MKKVTKFIAFVCLFCFLWNMIFKILWLSDTPLSLFYKERKNSLDIVYVGASNTHWHFNSPLAYHLYGYTTGFLSSGYQPFTMIKYLLEESEFYQNPELYVIDVTQFALDLDVYREGYFRSVVDSMKFSKNRIDAIDEFLNDVDITKIDSETKSGNNRINYYFSYLLYHNRWKNIDEERFTGNHSLYKGYTFGKNLLGVRKLEKYEWPEKKEELPIINEESLKKLINYIKDKNLNVLFVIPKRTFREEEPFYRLNTITSIIEQNKFKIINFNTLDDFEVDFSKDFYNQHHLNTYGATKYTLYFSKYLHDHYKLKDHRKDEKYQSWENEYQRFKSDFKELTKSSFDDILVSYQKKEGM